ncbi:hypothetical protein [Methylobacterium phyllosphaerae]|uniref:hypothetical protein n=1 Tax=Methylobacterium phyllosphaerae TaxID=418223 RepID=UPI001F3EB077|nr:hypothetical protein [Methylobacterium phyllosphaerae]
MHLGRLLLEGSVDSTGKKSHPSRENRSDQDATDNGDTQGQRKHVLYDPRKDVTDQICRKSSGHPRTSSRNFELGRDQSQLYCYTNMKRRGYQLGINLCAED